MTRKHFTAIASILAQHAAPAGLAADLANYFAAENPRFDIERFMTAAGIDAANYRLSGGHFGPATAMVTP